MRALLLSLFLLFAGSVSAQEQVYYCYQYLFTVVDTSETQTTLLFEDEICYESPVTIKTSSGDLIRVTTDSLDVVFVRLTSTETSPTGKRTFWAARAGYTGYMYQVRFLERNGGFVLSFTPVGFNNLKRHAIRKALVFAYSTDDIFSKKDQKTLDTN